MEPNLDSGKPKLKLKMKLVGVFRSFQDKMNPHVTFVIKHILSKVLETRVYRCKLYFADEKGLFNSCNPYLEFPVLSYQQDEECYVAVVESVKKKKEIIMGFKDDIKKKGQIENTWTIDNIALIQNRAYIFAEVRKIKVMMINDFSQNSTLWVYYNHKNLNTQQFFTYSLAEGKRYFMVEFVKKGLLITDVTPSYFIEVSYSHITSLNAIEVYQDNQKIVELQPVLWDQIQIMDLQEKPIDVIYDINNNFFCRTYYRGKNMVFEDGTNYIVQYFNEAKIAFSIKNKEDTEVNMDVPYMIFDSDDPHIIYILQADRVFEFSCNFFRISNYLLCNMNYEIQLIGQKDLNNVTGLFSIGAFLIIKNKRLRDIRVLNLELR